MSSPAPRRILVVEDNLYVQIFYRTALRRAGYEVVAVASGGDAVPRARECRPDLIILDLLLPDVQGKDVLRLLKSSPELARVPVVVVSSLVPADQARLGREGAVCYIRKDKLTEELLLSSVTEALSAEPAEAQQVVDNGS